MADKDARVTPTMTDTSAVSGASSPPNAAASTSLPSVEQRLADLRPSRELLEFYRQKIAEYDDEYSTLLKRFETLSSTQEDRRRAEEELKSREAEVHQLQKALSDIQVFLMQERENVVRLYAENDRLKLRQFEDSKKIQVWKGGCEKYVVLRENVLCGQNCVSLKICRRCCR